jgi:hypothetical protein
LSTAYWHQTNFPAVTKVFGGRFYFFCPAPIGQRLCSGNHQCSIKGFLSLTFAATIASAPNAIIQNTMTALLIFNRLPANRFKKVRAEPV